MGTKPRVVFDGTGSVFESSPFSRRGAVFSVSGVTHHPGKEDSSFHDFRFLLFCGISSKVIPFCETPLKAITNDLLDFFIPFPKQEILSRRR